MDLTGGSMSMMKKQVYGLLQLAAQVGSNNYPEIMGTLQVVNAPFFFSGVWAIVKSFLDERTKKKLKLAATAIKRNFLK